MNEGYLELFRLLALNIEEKILRKMVSKYNMTSYVSSMFYRVYKGNWYIITHKLICVSENKLFRHILHDVIAPSGRCLKPSCEWT